MVIDRTQLVELLRSRGSEKTAQRVEELLPEQIDDKRDRERLRQCGIDINAVAALIRSHPRQDA